MGTKAPVWPWDGRRAATRARTALRLCAVAGIARLLAPSPALADFKLCNATTSRIGVAVGYKDPRDWTTEGWWSIRPRNCETLLKGDLPSRFVYVYAIDYDRGGEWAGKSFMCTDDRSFLIRDIKDCEQRGHARTGFVEVDTGDAKDWTIRLTDTDEQRSSP